MRLSDLRDTKVKTLDGESLGCVHEVHCDAGRVTALICGAGSWIESLTGRSKGRRIPWECVRKADRTAVIVTPDPPRRSKAGAARTPQGTRRASAKRSKR